MHYVLLLHYFIITNHTCILLNMYYTFELEVIPSLFLQHSIIALLYSTAMEKQEHSVDMQVDFKKPLFTDEPGRYIAFFAAGLTHLEPFPVDPDHIGCTFQHSQIRSGR